MSTFASLYSGLGGADLGLEQAGWRCVQQVECDPWRRAVLAAHWPDVPRARRVEDLTADDLADVTLLYAGPPSRDPEWLAEVWRVAALTYPEFLVIESGGRCVPALTRGFADLGYFGIGIGVTGVMWRHDLTLAHRPLFAVARRETSDGLSVLRTETDATSYQVMQDLRGFDPATACEVMEMINGFPLAWTCVCGVGPYDCTETSTRLVAINEAVAPSITRWLGERLLALLPSEVNA